MEQQSLAVTNTKLERIAWLSKQDPDKEFNCLMHLFNRESLIACFHEQDGNKAIGIDGINKMIYKATLDNNIEALINKMKTMSYRPGPVKEVFIPKEGSRGATRALGISNFEDKIVQKMFQKVLESIYEPLFLDCSYGFRPGRSSHTAILDLTQHLYENEIQTVIDIDLKNYFGTISQELLENILREKIKDSKFMRYIIRMFKAGVLSEGEMKVNEEGLVQGSSCSPILANVFAHYALDKWIEEDIKPNCKGEVRLFRFADDGIICCQYETDAQAILKVLGKRLAKFNLQLNEEKTKLVSFNKGAANHGIKQGTFDFLGFTFYLGKSRSGGMIPKLKTRSKTLKAKLKKVNEWAKGIRNKCTLKVIWKTFKVKLRGHIQYYAVSHNFEKVQEFLYKATQILFKWLNRRSQKKSFNWKKFNLFIERDPLPKVYIVHKLF